VITGAKMRVGTARKVNPDMVKACATASRRYAQRSEKAIL